MANLDLAELFLRGIAGQVLGRCGGWLGIAAAVGASAWYLLRRVRQGQTAPGQTTAEA